MADKLTISPIEFKEACEFINQYHRHHRPPVGHRFSLAVHQAGLVGVAIFGRPVARQTNAIEVLEVSRVCTDGTLNACSCLLGAGTRVARGMGFKRIQTFTLKREPGSSLKAVGWNCKVIENGFGWLSRDRNPDQIAEQKVKWWVDING